MATRKKNQIAVLPLSVQIGGFDVKISPMSVNEEGWSNAMGTYHNGQVNISLDNEPQRVAMCLVHELIHAAFDHSGLRYKYNDINGVDVEEEIVSSLGFTLSNMIGTQHELVDFVRSAWQGNEIALKEGASVKVTGGGSCVAPTTMKRNQNKKRVFKR